MTRVDGESGLTCGVPIRDLNRALGWSLPDDHATTIAGLVIHETQSIPEERQAFTFHGQKVGALPDLPPLETVADAPSGNAEIAEDPDAS